MLPSRPPEFQFPCIPPMRPCLSFSLAALAWGLSVAVGDGEEVFFEGQIRPILKAHCWQCHGEADEHQGKLDVRLARLILKGGESGAALVPGKPAESLLLAKVKSGEMPGRRSSGRNKSG
jgi:Planctomycete cytochrome C